MVEHESRLDSLKSLPRQGQMLRFATPEAAPIWAKAIQSLPQRVFKFALNTAHGTLPHNSNLHLWKNRSPAPAHSATSLTRTCLLHVWNNCNVALELRRYDVRHDQVLQSIAATTCDNLPLSTPMSADLSDGYAFPNHIVATNQRPDIVWWNDEHKTITMLELTVCFETSYEAETTRKEDRYTLTSSPRPERPGTHPRSSPSRWVSRDLPKMAGFQWLRDALKLSTQKFRKLLTDASQQLSHHSSYTIWCSRNCTI